MLVHGQSRHGDRLAMTPLEKEMLPRTFIEITRRVSGDYLYADVIIFSLGAGGIIW